eukprot:616896-Karenia_brevis.AAC.1
MDSTLHEYHTELDRQTRDTRLEIIDLLENMQGIVNRHDEELDKSRNRAIEAMTRAIGTFRGE